MRNREKNNRVGNAGGKKLARVMLAGAAAAMLCARQVRSAVTDTWAGGGGDDNWMTTGNWTTTNAGQIPVAADLLSFSSSSGSTQLTSNNDFTAGTSFGGLTFGNGAGAFVLGGNNIALTGALADNSQGGTAETINFAIASTAALQLGSDSGQGANGNGGSGGQNLVLNANDSFASLSVTTNSTTADTLNIGSGDTLTINGAASFGVAATTAITASTTVTLNSAGTGNLNINAGTGNFTLGVSAESNSLGTDTATMNLSSLSSFTFSTTTGQFLVGFGGRSLGTLTLSGTANSITTATFSVGNSNTLNAPGSAVSQVLLGGGTNVINANTITLGQGKSSGNLVFAGSGGSLTIAGETGGTSTANITLSDATTASFNQNSNLSLAGHTATVQAGTVIVGELAGATASAIPAAITFDTGTFNAANLELADDASGSDTSGVSGTFTLGGSTPNTTATGVLQVGTPTTPGNFYLANLANATNSSNNAGTFVINGGTANIYGNISINVVAGDTASASTTLTLAGGTLNMEGNSIASVAHPVNNLNLPASGQTATVENLGGLGINGAGVNMNSGGTLILAGNNTFTGTTILNGGTLQFGSATPAINSVLTMNGGTLAFSPSIGTFQIGGLASNATVNLADTNGVAATLKIGALGGSYSGSLTGSGGLIMAGTNGTTVQTLSGTNSYSGNTTVTSGTLAIEGPLYSGVASPGTVTVNGGTLAGNNQISAPVSLTSGTIMPDANGGILHLSSLTTTGGSLAFALNGATMNSILVDNTATLGSGTLLSFADSAPVTGTYPILTAGSLSNSIFLAPIVVGTVTFTPFVAGNELEVTVTGTPSNLIWVGANNSGAWDIASTKNWNNQTSSTNPDVFHNNDFVTFDDSTSNNTVNITAAVQPQTVTFNNSSKSYVINSSNGNGIGGTGTLTIDGGGPGTVTLNTANTYSGNTDISNSGALIIGSTGVVVSANMNITGGSLTINSGGSYTGANANVSNGTSMTVASGGLIASSLNLINNGTVAFGSSQTIATLNSANNGQTNGSITLNQTGTLAISGGGSYGGSITGTGGLNVSGGTLVLNGGNTYGGATTINTGATLQIDSGNSSGTLNPSSVVTNNGSLVFDRGDGPTFSNNIGGSGSVTQNGSGTLTLNGTNTYGGGVNINQGSLTQGSPTARRRCHQRGGAGHAGPGDRWNHHQYRKSHHQLQHGRRQLFQYQQQRLG